MSEHCYIYIFLMGILMFNRLYNVLCFVLFIGTFVVGSSHIMAQNSEKRFDVYVDQLTRLASGDIFINLWGVAVSADPSGVLDLRGRVALDDHINRKAVLCTLLESRERSIDAQCVNEYQQDLSLFLLQEGYVSADRRAVYGTVYETAYLEAERQARDRGRGIWGYDAQSQDSSNFAKNSDFILATLLLIVVFMVGLAVLIFLLLNGFRRVLDLQNKALNLRGKDQALRHKEKSITAMLIYSEINENKDKIGAYLTIHEDMLKNFEVSNRQKLGDIIQKQPVLSRSVFDGNTGKLELFGERLASEIIHYYARIKSRPDYVEVTADTPRGEVVSLIKDCVHGAQKLSALSELLLESFEQHALVKKTTSF